MTTITATRPSIDKDTFLRQIIESAYRRVDDEFPPAVRPEAAAAVSESFRRDAAAFRAYDDDLSENTGWTTEEWAELYDRVADVLAGPRFYYRHGTPVALVTTGPSTVAYPEGTVTASTIDSVTIVHRGVSGPREVTVTRDSWEDGTGNCLGAIDPASGLLHVNV